MYFDAIVNMIVFRNFFVEIWKCNKYVLIGWLGFMLFNATFNNISVMSWRSILLVEETKWLGENHRHVASHWQTVLL